jgi:oligopeptide/dipeptide ABC transporter ATP-binding protein
MAESLLEVKELEVTFSVSGLYFKAVDNVKFYIKKKETLGIIGESGCGKSVTALSIMGLIPNPPGRITSGEIIFEGEDLLKKSPKEMRKIRGNRISMIFQEPMTSLNPLMTIGEQIMEVYSTHKNMPVSDARNKAIEMLKLVGIPMAEQRIKDFPHQLSGGMRQRVMIAMALVCNPALLIADEPTTALDVTIQAQILKLIKDLKEKLDTSIIIISHDLGVIAEIADRVIVMYGGQIVEHSDVKSLFKDPLHPYTIGLLNSIPRVDVKQDTLQPIEGMVPSIYDMPKGCRFAPRCKIAKEICHTSEPDLVEVENRQARCFKYSKSREVMVNWN